MKKSVFIVLLAAFAFHTLFLPTTAIAQTWWEPSMGEFADRVAEPPDAEVYGERYTYAQTRWIIMSIIFWFIPMDVYRCLDVSDGIFETIPECADMFVPGSGAISSNKTPGALLSLASYAYLLLNQKPASGLEYIASTAADLHLIPEANAQGFGYSSALVPARALWLATRNVAYTFLIFVIIIMAFLIMFRVQIAPRVVITIQSAIPKIAMVLILITFSYAIAGLLVDLAFLTQGIVVSIARASGLLDPTGAASFTFTRLQDINGGTIAYAWLTIIRSTLYGGIACVITRVPLLCNIMDFILSLILFLVIFITIFRIFWTLLKAYATLLIMIIAGPFIILGGLIAQQIGFTFWLKHVIANLSVFVMATFLVFAAHVFAWGMAPDGYYGVLQTWPMINPFYILSLAGVGGTGILPGVSFGDTATIGFLVGLATMIATPSLSQAAKNFILGIRGQYGGELLGAAALGAVVGKGFGGEAMGRFMRFGTSGGTLKGLIPGLSATSAVVGGAAGWVGGRFARTRAGGYVARATEPARTRISGAKTRFSTRLKGSAVLGSVVGGVGKFGTKAGTAAQWWRREVPGEEKEAGTPLAPFQMPKFGQKGKGSTTASKPVTKKEDVA